MIDAAREAYFWPKVSVGGDCWPWLASLDRHGYGQFNIGGGVVRRAHGVAYGLLRGAVPDGLELDHLCRNKACVNPWHLEPVTHRENLHRGEGACWQLNAAKTHCHRGHEFTPANTGSSPSTTRYCRECKRLTNNQRSTA